MSKTYAEIMAEIAAKIDTSGRQRTTGQDMRDVTGDILEYAKDKTTGFASITGNPTDNAALAAALAACDQVFVAYRRCNGKVDTIYTEIQAAVNAGKIAVLYYADSEWSMLCTNDAGEGGAFGFSNTEATSSVISYIGDDDVWHRESYNLEETANKKTTLTNSDTDYPTTKAVKTVTDDLSGRITNISTIGRFLSVWSLAGGLPLDNPTTPLPYAYRRGDYYIASSQVVEGKAVTVGGKVFQPLNNVINGRRQYQRRYGPGSAVESRFFPEGSTPAVGDTMFRTPYETTPTGGTVTAVQDSFALIPTGDSYTGAASTVHATGYPADNTMFVYTGTGWVAVNAQGQTVAFANIAGQPTDNANLAAALNGKQDTINDLATIRSGAALGATALQSVPNTYRTSAAQDVIDATKITNPSGGTTGQVLTKTASGEEWATPQGGDATAEEVTAAALNDIYDQTLSASRKTLFKSDIVNDLTHPYPNHPISAYIAWQMNNKFAEIELVAAAALNDLDKTKAFMDCVAPAWNGQSTYAVGDLRTHDGKLWKCDTAITTPEAVFDASKWHTTTIVEEFITA